MAIERIFGNGVSALLAFQRALATTSQNVANVNTEGYSRQRAELVTRPPERTSAGFVGSGVEVGSVRRLANEFIETQLRTSTNGLERFETLHRLAGRVDSLLADPNTGLSSAMQGFFDAVEGVANDPTSVAAREVLLGNAGTLAARFHFLQQSFDELNNQVNGELRNAVIDINGLAQAIADTNRAIVTAQGQASGQSPADLLDRRDQLIMQLAQRVDVSTLAGDDGSVTVSVGSGHTLVIGGQSRPLVAASDPFDPSRIEIAFEDGNPISNQLVGGNVGGLLDFRTEVLDPAYNALGRVAIGLAQTVNEQHQLGQDLEGSFGGQVFDVAQPRVLSHVNNTSNTFPTVTIDDVGALSASDYLLRFDGSVWSLSDRSNGQLVALSGSGTDADPFLADGLSISIQGVGVAPGDDYRFVIQPTRRGAEEINLVIDDPRKVAAAAPIRTQSTVANLGDGVISQSGATDTTVLPLSSNGGDITLVFDPDAVAPGVPGFLIAGGPGGSLAYDPASEGTGKPFVLGPPFSGISFSISGTPAAGDSFVISDNVNGVGDNRNALALSELRSALSLVNGSASYQDAYNQLVADVGVKTRQAEISRDTQSELHAVNFESRQSISGVNLDEEAANLLRFQQAYQASTRVIAAADNLFQELLGALRG